MFTLIIVAAAFIGVASLVGGVAILLRGHNKGLEDRLAMLVDSRKGRAARGKPAAEVLLVNNLDKSSHWLLTSISQFLNLRRLLDQADVTISPGKFLMVTFGVSMGAALICAATRKYIVFAPLAAIAMAALPFLWLILKRRKRLKNFARQLPEALELISRALRAGHSLAAGINLVAQEMKEPIGKEFTRSYEAQNLGIPLEDTLEEMTDRVPNLDLRFFVTAIVLQRQTGGDLAEILDKIGRLIRERFQIWGQIQALTGEGRLSGIVLLALPPVLFIAMWRINPEYLMVLFTDPLGNKMLAAAAVLMLIGALVIKKIINIKV